MQTRALDVIPDGFEPPASCLSRRRSPPELRDQKPTREDSNLQRPGSKPGASPVRLRVGRTCSPQSGLDRICTGNLCRDKTVLLLAELRDRDLCKAATRSRTSIRPIPRNGSATELPRLQNTTGWTRTTNLSVIGGVLCPMSYGRTMVALTCQRTATENGPRWGSNPRRAAFQTAALPAELPGQDFILRDERAPQPPAFPAANKAHTRARKNPRTSRAAGRGSSEETCVPTHMITDPVPKPELSSRPTPTAAPPRGTRVANQLWPLCPRYILDQLLQRRSQRQQ